VSSGCKCPFPAGGGANSAPPNPLARFEGPLPSGERERGKRREKRGMGNPLPEFLF